MTRSQVERYQRTATRPTFMPSAGVRSILLPTSQGVEERPGRPAGRTATRIGLRTLVIGGFAGAAWLLSGAAAQASGPNTSAEPTSGGASVVSLVDDLGNGVVERPTTAASTSGSQRAATRPATSTASVLLGDVLVPVDRATSVVLPRGTAAASTPIRTDRPANQPDRTAGSVVRHLADRASTAFAAVAPGGTRGSDGAAGSTTGGLLALANQLAAPLRPVDATAGSSGLIASVTTVVDPVVDPLVRTRRPVTDLLRVAAAPVTATLGPATAAVTGSNRQRPAQSARPGSDDVSSGATYTGAAVPAAVRSTGTAVRNDVPRPARFRAHPAVAARPGPVSAGARGGIPDRPATGAHQRTAGSSVDPTGADPAPERPEPAPLRAFLGCGGVSTNGSSAPSDGGAFATVASSVTDGTVACHRLSTMTDAALRRSDAEAPTVSPD